jgi:hypothetical protein
VICVVPTQRYYNIQSVSDVEFRDGYEFTGSTQADKFVEGPYASYVHWIGLGEPSVASKPTTGNRGSSWVKKQSGDGGYETIGVIAPALGVNLPAAPIASNNRNNLDCYDESDFVSSITCSTSGTITCGVVNTLRVTRDGERVIASGTLTVTAISAPVGAIQIAMPFPAGAGNEFSAAAEVLVSGAVNTWTGAPTGFVSGGGSILYVYEFAAGGLNNAAAKVQVGTQFIVSVSYVAA